MTKSKIQNEKGVSLYIAFMVMTMLLGIGFGMSALLLSQLDTLKGVGYSVFAFYATDAGIERAMYEDNKGCVSKQVIAEHITCLQGRIAAIPQDELKLSNGARFELCDASNVCVQRGGQGVCPVGNSYCVRSVGVYNQIRRAVRIAR